MHKKEYDVVIIGAGIGGMCAAARLAMNGYKTLMVERLSFLGGRCSSIETDGYQISTGVAMVPEGSLEQTFREVGAEFDVKDIDHNAIYSIKGKYFCTERGLRTALKEFAEDQDGAGKIMDAIGLTLKGELPVEDINFKEWLSKYTEDKNILTIFQDFSVFVVGECIEELPTYEYFNTLKAIIKNKTTSFKYPPNGNIGLINALAVAIEKHGGEIWKDAETKKIFVDGNKAAGITVEKSDGEWEISARFVISNTGPKKTVDLTGKEYFDDDYLKEVDLIKPTPPCIEAHIVSDEPLFDLDGVVQCLDAPKPFMFWAPTLKCTGVAPPGKHLLVSYTGLPEDVSSNAELKKEIDLHMEILKQMIPDFEKKGTVKSVQCFRGEWPLYRSSSHLLDQKTTIENLYNVGDGVKISGLFGTQLCAETARIVAEGIMINAD